MSGLLGLGLAMRCVSCVYALCGRRSSPSPSFPACSAAAPGSILVRTFSPSAAAWGGAAPPMPPALLPIPTGALEPVRDGHTPRQESVHRGTPLCYWLGGDRVGGVTDACQWRRGCFRGRGGGGRGGPHCCSGCRGMVHFYLLKGKAYWGPAIFFYYVSDIIHSKS